MDMLTEYMMDVIKERTKGNKLKFVAEERTKAKVLELIDKFLEMEEKEYVHCTDNRGVEAMRVTVSGLKTLIENEL